MTVSFKFRLFARRVVSGTNCIGIRSGNLLSFATTTDGQAVYFDLDNQGFDIPAPGGYSESSGWHAVMVSFDSATGVLQAYFDGQLGVNKTGFKQGKSSAGTFGPGLSSLRLAQPQLESRLDPLSLANECRHASKAGGIESFVVSAYGVVTSDEQRNMIGVVPFIFAT
jgi:hypothetical protein